MEISKNTTLSGVDDSAFRVCGGAELSHRGILNGNVEIVDGSFVLYGILNGSLDVSVNGIALIHGTANLKSVLGPGQIELFGTVNSDAVSESRFVLHPGCVVNGIKH